MAYKYEPHAASSIAEDEAFWLVWKLGGDVPRKRHANFESAAAEAERLAVNMPGETFFVLEAMESFQSRQVVRTKLLHPVQF